MASTPTASTARTDAHEEFLALLCADEDFVRAEFAAIIDANWDQPKPPRSMPPGPPARPGGGRPMVAATTWSASARREHERTWCRVRSPPPSETARGSLAVSIDSPKGR